MRTAAEKPPAFSRASPFPPDAILLLAFWQTVRDVHIDPGS